jgi:hypothetical protein
MVRHKWMLMNYELAKKKKTIPQGYCPANTSVKLQKFINGGNMNGIT